MDLRPGRARPSSGPRPNDRFPRVHCGEGGERPDGVGQGGAGRVPGGRTDNFLLGFVAFVFFNVLSFVLSIIFLFVFLFLFLFFF